MGRMVKCAKCATFSPMNNISMWAGLNLKAIRELGTKYKNKFDKTIKERNTQWAGINSEK